MSWSILGFGPLFRGANASKHGEWFIHVKTSPLTFNFVKGKHVMTLQKTNEVIHFGIRSSSLNCTCLTNWVSVLHLFKQNNLLFIYIQEFFYKD